MNANKQKRTGGFTLIELIVVIAILGILAGVGTVAYTGYVKRANKGVDEQLISDVAYSMYLASYADPNFLEGEAYVVGLQYDHKPALKAVGADEGTTGEAKLKNALEMSFGTGCTDNKTLALTYDGWKLGSVTGVLSLVESSYHGKEEQLLGDIQTFTDSLKEFLGDDSDVDSRLNMVLNSSNSDYAKYLNSMNATTSQEAANATTLYLAQYAANKSNPDEYAQWWASGFAPESIPKEIAEAADKFNDPNSYNSDEAYDATGDIMMFYAAKVAAAEAAYQYVTDKEGADDTLTAKFNAIRSANGLSDLMQAVTNFNSEIEDKLSYEDWRIHQAAKDAKAYIQCLNAINESSDSFAGNLSQQGGQDTGLYTDGKALSMVTSYVSTAQAVNAMGLNENSAAVAITVCKDSNGKIMVTVYKNGETQTMNGDSGSDGPEIPTTEANATWNVTYNGFVSGNASPNAVPLKTGETLTLSGTTSYDNLKDSITASAECTWEDLKDDCGTTNDKDTFIYLFGSSFTVDFVNTDSDSETRFTCTPSYNDAAQTITFIVKVSFAYAGTYSRTSNSDGPVDLVVTVTQ